MIGLPSHSAGDVVTPFRNSSAELRTQPGQRVSMVNQGGTSALIGALVDAKHPVIPETDPN